MTIRVLGVIPARGGSKRFPKKNIAKLDGKELIHYSIDAAKKAKLLTDCIFSTDDEEIRTIALQLGAFAPFLRPKSISGDNVRNGETLLHAVKFMESLTGINYDYIVLLHPTSPLRTELHIDEAIMKLFESDSTTLASVKGPYKKRDINLKRIEGEKLVNLIPDNEEYYIYNAAIYIVGRAWLEKTKRFTSENEVGYVMDEVSSVDVDSGFDLCVAEAALRYSSRSLNDEKV